MRNILFILIFIPVFSFSQNFFQENRDTTFVKDGYQISFIVDIDEKKGIDFEPFEPYKNPIIRSLDSLPNHLQERMSGEYPSTFTCENGFKVIYQGYAGFLAYYPVEQIIHFGQNKGYLGWSFRVTDGKFIPPPPSYYTSSDEKFRWITNNYNDEHYKYFSVEIWDDKKKEFVPFLDFFDVLATSVRKGDLHDDIFYFLSGYNIWGVTIKEVEE